MKRAFAGWFKRVAGPASSVSLLIGVGLLLWHPPASIENAVSSMPNIFFLGLFPATILIRLIQSPYWLRQNERATGGGIVRGSAEVRVLAQGAPRAVE